MEGSFAASVQGPPCPWCSAHLARGSGQAQRVSWLARRRRLAATCTARAADGGAAPPWVLMGRSVHVDASRVAEPDVLWGTVVIKAKAMSALRSEQAFTEALDTVLALLPGLSGRLRRVKPELLSRLVDDTNAIAARLVQLKVLFPDNTDVEQLVSNRPELLLDHEFERLPDALAKLQAAFPDSDVGSMVAAQPLLLVEDIALVIDELRRLLPGNPNPVPVLVTDTKLLSLLTLRLNLRLAEQRQTQW